MLRLIAAIFALASSRRCRPCQSRQFKVRPRWLRRFGKLAARACTASMVSVCAMSKRAQLVRTSKTGVVSEPEASRSAR